MRAEVESTKEALSLAIENFKNYEEFKEEILEGGFASYCIGYKAGLDTVKKLYPNLDLSNIIPLCSEMKLSKKGLCRSKMMHRLHQKLFQ